MMKNKNGCSYFILILMTVRLKPFNSAHHVGYFPVLLGG